MAGSWSEYMGGGSTAKPHRTGTEPLPSESLALRAAAVATVLVVLVQLVWGSVLDAAIVLMVAGAWAVAPSVLPRWRRRAAHEASEDDQASREAEPATEHLAPEPLPAPAAPEPFMAEPEAVAPPAPAGGVRLAGIGAALVAGGDTMARTQADIERSRSLLREAVAGIFESYNGLNVRVQQQQQLVVRMAGRLAGGRGNDKSDGGLFQRFVAETEGSMNELVQQILKVAKQSVHMAHHIDDITTKVVEIERVASRAQKLADASSMLAVNAKIEATKAGRHAAGFSVVASEVQNLAVESRAFNEQISELIHEVRAEVDQTQLVIKELASQDMNLALLARSRADEMGNEVGALDAHIRESLETVANIATDVERDVALGIRHLQFEDIVTQVLEQSALALERLTGGTSHLGNMLSDSASVERIEGAIEGLTQACEALHVKAEQQNLEEGAVELF